MRVALALLLIFGILAAVHCEEEAQLGTEDNPYPEEHEHSGEGEDHADGNEGEDDEGGDEAEGEDALKSYEDTGEGAAITKEHLRMLHKKLDHDKDGKVAMHEVLHYAETINKKTKAKEIAGVFDEIDSTKDGHLSLEEHMQEVAEFHEGDEEEKALQRKHDEAKFKAADANGDNKLDKDELVALMHPETHPEVLEIHTQEEMRKRDTNKDGKLSKEEWEAAGPSHPDGIHHEPNPEAEKDHFENLDEDKDGHISMTELRHWESGRFHTHDAMKKLFELADKDSDSHMTEHEMAEIVEQIDGHDAHSHILDWVFHEEEL